MTTSLELVVGPSRTGKTTYAKSRSGKVFLCHDDMLYHAEGNFGVMKATLVSTLNNHMSKDFIIDGWFSVRNWDPKSVLDLKKQTNREVTLTCFYAPLEDLLGRTQCETREDIIAWYQRLAHFYRDELCAFPFVFRDFEREFSFTEYMRLVRPQMVTVSREDVISFISELDGLRSYDRYYQTINLPYSISLPGYERTESAWQTIADHVDFRGKTVLDAGCYHNFCGRAAEDAGARRVVGLDRIEQVLQNAKRISNMWGYETRFVKADLDDWAPNEHFDVVMCLNAIQYVKHPEEVARRLFDCGDMVIIEAHTKFKKIFQGIRTHRLVRESPSPRAEYERVLYFYEREPTANSSPIVHAIVGSPVLAQDRRPPSKEEMFMNDLVSVIIPTYNRADFLSQAIESALKQTYKHIEVIVVDDGSTDDTSRVCQRYEDERLRYVRKPNGGIGSALNRGISLMRGEWFKWLSSDDYLQPEAVELLLRKAQDVGGKIIYSSYRIVDADGQVMQCCPEYDMDYLSFALDLVRKHVGNGSSILIHRSVFEKVGLFDETLRAAEDYDFWLRACLLHRYRFHALGAFMLNYRVHEKQLTAQLAHQGGVTYRFLTSRNLIRKRVMKQIEATDPVFYRFLAYHLQPRTIQDGTKYMRRFFIPFLPKPLMRIILRCWFRMKKKKRHAPF